LANHTVVRSKSDGIVYEQLTEREPEYSWIQYATTPEFAAKFERRRLEAVFDTPVVGIRSRPADACTNCSRGSMGIAFVDFRLVGR
jgi:hypothetical protein